jgi:TonB family protein
VHRAKITLLLSACLIVCASVPAQAEKEELQLKPSSKWQVDYADDSCRLARQFGQDTHAVTLIIEQFGPGQSFKLTLAGPAFKQVSGEGSIYLKFGPAEDVQDEPYYLGSIGKAPALLLRTTMRIAPPSKEERQALKRPRDEETKLASISEDRVAAVSELNIGKPLRQPMRIFLGSMRAPFSALDKCINELMTHWGVDVTKYATQSRPLRSNQKRGAWIGDEDYPKNMISQGKRAMLNVRLSVDATGVPTACHLQQSTGPKEFDDTVCRALMRRARFEPALDAEGKPFASFFRQSINFNMP